MLGTLVGFLSDVPTAAEITAYGRQNLPQVRTRIESKFTRAAGYACDTRVVYGDTDSVMVEMRDATLEPAAANEYGDVLEADVNAMFVELYGARDDNLLRIENEGAKRPFYLAAKKRYAYDAWEVDDADGVFRCTKQLVVAGMEGARRDSTPLVKRVAARVLGTLLDADTSLALDARLERIGAYVREARAGVESNTLSFAELIETRKLSRPIDSYNAARARPPHVELAARLRARHGAESPLVPTPGERMPFVMVEATQRTDAPLSACAERPRDAWRAHAVPNRRHYLQAIDNVVHRLLEPFVGRRTVALSERRRSTTLAAQIDAMLGVRATGKRAHATTTSRSVAARVGAAHVVVRRRCAVCGTRCDDDVCAACRATGDADAHATRADDERAAAAAERAALWRTCQTCIGTPDRALASDIESLECAVECDNEDCATLWARLANDRRRTTI